MERIVLYLAFVYVPIVCAVLYAYAKRKPTLRIIFKSLFVPSLAALYLLAAERVSAWILLALLFGWLGDIALLGRKHWNLYAGMGLFGIGHVCYITGMLCTRPRVSPLAAVSAVWIVGCLFLVGKLLLPRVPKRLRIPGAAYALLLSANAATALYLACVSDPHAPYVLCFFGGLVFIISDGLIAYDKFGRKTALGQFFIMATYILAQTALIAGFLLHGGI